MDDLIDQLASTPLSSSTAATTTTSLNNNSISITGGSSSGPSGGIVAAASHEDESMLRKRIMLIQRDQTIPAPEKARRIQELMMSKYKLGSPRSSSIDSDNDMISLIAGMNNQSANNNCPSSCGAPICMSSSRQDRANDGCTTVKCIDTGREVRIKEPEDLQKSFHTSSTAENDHEVFGCKHYSRSCKILAECCQKWVVCRLCHDEVCDHQINRYATKTIMCMHCNTVQQVGSECKNCHETMGEYFCEICKLWESNPDKHIYHCDKCGLCRLGQGIGIDYFHCDRCNACLSIAMQENHRCIERNLESNCPICDYYLFTSTQPVIFIPCGHPIHYRCYQEHIENSYQCPICWKSLADMTNYFRQLDQMLQEHTMPKEYENYWSICLCNDCEKKSRSKYHFLYHKCQECGSYNTKLLQTIQEINTDVKADNSGSDETAMIDDTESNDGMVIAPTPPQVTSTDAVVTPITEIIEQTMGRPRSSSNLSDGTSTADYLSPQ